MAATLKCVHCGGDLDPGDRFCAQCGAELRSCVGCGETLLPGDRSCPECGTPAETSDEIDPQAPWIDMVERLRRGTLGEYEIGPELGRGGMAAVFLAHDISLNRQVAIKVMSPGLMLGDGMIERFRHEAITVAQLQHPNIVSVYSVRHAEGVHFFAMRYVRGCSLEQVIQKAGRLPVPVAQSILYQVGSALTYAHRFQVIHRDIKPANILLDEEGNAVVTDFGIAKAAETPTRTLTGALVGTPAYMSPEQCSSAEVTWASDQYALGVVAYEMLTGVPPFSGSTLTVMQSHVEETPLPLRELRGDCPPELEDAVLRMLEKHPAARWPRMAEALAALGAAPLPDDHPLRADLTRMVAAAVDGSGTSAVTPTSPVPRTRPSAADLETPARPVGAISILPPPAGLEVGDSFVLVAMVRGQKGTRLPPTAVTWSCDAPGILRFEPGGGVALAVAPGSVLLTAACRGVEAELRLEIAAPRADTITIAPVDRAVEVGDQVTLEATAFDKRGQRVDRPVTWASHDLSTATIEPDGSLEALAEGFARISASLDEARASITIPILPAGVAALRIGDWPAAVQVGSIFTVEATPVDRWENPLDDRNVYWSSSDPDVATMADGGVVTTHRGGTIALTATCEGVSASVQVRVEEAPGTILRSSRRRRRRQRRIALLAASVAAVAGGAGWYFSGGSARTVSAADAAPRQPVTDSFVPAPVASAPTVMLAAESSAGTVAREADPVPTPRPRTRPRRSAPAAPVPASVAIAPVEPLAPGDTAALQAEVRDTAGQPIANAGVIWRSSDPGVASIDSASGVVRAQSPGSAVIIAQSGTESALYELSVDAPEIAADTAADDSVTEQLAYRAPEPAPAEPTPAPPRELPESHIRAGVAACYDAVRERDPERLAALYRPANRQDEDKLKKLSRILRNSEWSAVVGDRVDGLRQVGQDAAAMEFSFDLAWRDAFGGRLSSRPVFRAEFTRDGDRWRMASCRIIGSPRL